MFDLQAAGTISLDFPWLKYGLMPILGGTQRLPRLCGIELAAQMLLQAEKVTVEEAAASGSFEVKDHGLSGAAVEWVQSPSKARTTLGQNSAGTFVGLFSTVVEPSTPPKDLSQAPPPRHS